MEPLSALQPDRAQQARRDGRHARRERPRRVPATRRHRRRPGHEPDARHAREARARLGDLSRDQRPAGLHRGDVARRDRAVPSLARLRHGDGGDRRARPAPALPRPKRRLELLDGDGRRRGLARDLARRAGGALCAQADRTRPVRRPLDGRELPRPDRTGLSRVHDHGARAGAAGEPRLRRRSGLLPLRRRRPLARHDDPRRRRLGGRPARNRVRPGRPVRHQRIAALPPRRARRPARVVDGPAPARGGGRAASRRRCAGRPCARRRGRVRRPAPCRPRLLLGDDAGRLRDLSLSGRAVPVHERRDRPAPAARAARRAQRLRLARAGRPRRRGLRALVADGQIGWSSRPEVK